MSHSFRICLNFGFHQIMNPFFNKLVLSGQESKIRLRRNPGRREIILLRLSDWSWRAVTYTFMDDSMSFSPETSLIFLEYSIQLINSLSPLPG